MSWKYLYSDVLPFTAMVAMQCATVGSNILFKAASVKGLSYYPYILYSHVLGMLLLLPVPFIFGRTQMLASLKFPILGRICLLAIIGFLAQVVGTQGLEYSSPTLSSAMSNLTPAFTFIFAAIFRMEKLALRRSSTQAKIIGTLLSISGAMVGILYEGPTIFSAESPRAITDNAIHWLLRTSHLYWLIGGLLLATQNLIYSIGYILQANIMKMCPKELIVTYFYTLFVTIIALPICYIAENSFDIWVFKPGIALVAIIYWGFFGSFFSTMIQSWGLRLKGPVYVGIFNPLSIAIAAILDAIFLRDALHLGSIIGAVIISVGFYAVIWGKANEDRATEARTDEQHYANVSTGQSSNEKIPLLIASN